MTKLSVPRIPLHRPEGDRPGANQVPARSPSHASSPLTVSAPPDAGPPPGGTPGLTAPAIPDAFLRGVEMQLRCYWPEAPQGFLADAIRRCILASSPPAPLGLNRLLTADEVRGILGGISPMTLHRLMRSGQLSKVRVGKRRIAFDPADIDRFIQQRKRGGKRLTAVTA